MIQTKKLDIFGTVYKFNQFIVLDSDLGTAKIMLVFGEIENIKVVNEQVFFYCLRWSAIHLEETLNAYCIEKDEEFSLILSENLSD